MRASTSLAALTRGPGIDQFNIYAFKFAQFHPDFRRGTGSHELPRAAAQSAYRGRVQPDPIRRAAARLLQLPWGPGGVALQCDQVEPRRYAKWPAVPPWVSPVQRD